MTLTREEILAMEPGPTLDEITTEIACGRKVRMLNEVTYNSFKPQYDKKVIDEGAGRYNIIPRYSTDISAAWEVVTHLKSKNWYFMLSDENEGWEASFYWDPHRPAFEALSSTAPEAICKAALLAALKL
jgi:hypothetical protein